jgi:signal transduction histidine kinase
VAAGIGHELRNPISWITTNLQHSLAELGELSDALKDNDALRASSKVDEIRAALSDASMGAERVAGIVSAIQLSMLRPAGESEIVDLEEVVHLALRLVEGSCVGQESWICRSAAAPRCVARVPSSPRSSSTC